MEAEQLNSISNKLDDIAQRAGLSRRTAFRYFASKEELVFPEQASRQAAFEALLHRRLRQPPRLRWRGDPVGVRHRLHMWGGGCWGVPHKRAQPHTVNTKPPLGGGCGSPACPRRS